MIQTSIPRKVTTKYGKLSIFKREEFNINSRFCFKFNNDKYRNLCKYEKESKWICEEFRRKFV